MINTIAVNNDLRGWRVASPLFYAFVRGKSLNPAVRNFATETSVCGIHSEYFVFACTVLIGLQSMTDRYAQREREMHSSTMAKMRLTWLSHVKTGLSIEIRNMYLVLHVHREAGGRIPCRRCGVTTPYTLHSCSEVFLAADCQRNCGRLVD